MTDTSPPKSLVLVVGAGASKEAGLPIGSELKKQIATALDIRYDEWGSRKISGDDHIHAAFRQLATSINPTRPDINPLMQAGWRIRDAMPQAISIDNFIDAHRENDDIGKSGKLAIARCILTAESNSPLKIDRGNIYNKLNFSTLEATWFNTFFQLLTENCRQADLADRLSKVAIICFNYDRCIEHYLHAALQNYYAMSAEEATALLRNLAIYHPYGTVGKLPWQDPQVGIDFGATPAPNQLIALAGELRTFTEGVDTTKSNIEAIRATISKASRVAFLGFAFHRLNLDLLFPGLSDGEVARAFPVYGTALGLSTADIQVITRELQNLGGLRHEAIHLQGNLTCSQLLREYWRSLSLQ